MKYIASIILDSLTPSGGSLLAFIISAVLNSAICPPLARSNHLSPPNRINFLFGQPRSPASGRRGQHTPVDCPLVGDHMQTVLALVVPDYIAQVGHARHNLCRHAPRATEQPTPAQRHKAPMQRRCKEFIHEPERMAPLVEA